MQLYAGSRREKTLAAVALVLLLIFIGLLLAS